MAQDKTSVVILTGNFRITGNIDLLPGARVTDFLAESKEFIAVTEAEVADISGRRLFASGFLDVSRAKIEMVMPADMVTHGLHIGR